MKHQIVHTLQKYLLNPPIKLALPVGLPLPLGRGITAMGLMRDNTGSFAVTLVV